MHGRNTSRRAARPELEHHDGDRGGLGAIDTEIDRRLEEHREPSVLVGHSLGGLLALRAARRHPVRALALLMPAPPTGLLPTVLIGAVTHPYNTLRLQLSVSHALRHQQGGEDDACSDVAPQRRASMTSHQHKPR